MTEPRRRTTLTPLESELRFEEAHADPKPPGSLTRLRRRLRRERRPPKTLAGALALAGLRMTIAVGVASAVAALVNHVAHRSPSFGFYVVVGAFVLAATVLMSTGDIGTPHYYSQGERERRVSLSFSYVLAGLIAIGIAVAIDAFSG